LSINTIMNSQDLLNELKIRFNTSPKLYEKADYKILLKLLEEILDETPQSTTPSTTTNVSVTQTLTSGTPIGSISVNNTPTVLYAPNPTSITVTPVYTSGTKIADIVINGTTIPLYISSTNSGGGSSSGSSVTFSNGIITIPASRLSYNASTKTMIISNATFNQTTLNI